jgi:hypothetical protein
MNRARWLTRYEIGPGPQTRNRFCRYLRSSNGFEPVSQSVVRRKSVTRGNAGNQLLSSRCDCSIMIVPRRFFDVMRDICGISIPATGPLRLPCRDP